jgi:hypothetical protein
MKTFFLVALPVHAAAVVCNGTSTVLPQAQCEAWVDFFDAANGAGWIGFKYNPATGAYDVPVDYSTYRTDPCSITGQGTYPPVALNFCDKGGTTIQKM